MKLKSPDWNPSKNLETPKSHEINKIKLFE